MKRLLRLSAVALLAAATGVGVTATPAAAAMTIVVGPGQSIQAAVNRASAGDTILIKPGHYQQSVLVNKNYLHIRGSGSGLRGTVIEPAATPQGACARHGIGICVFDLPPGSGTVVGVSIDNLLVRNFKGSGVFGFHTAGVFVSNVVARNNGEYGIARFDSSGGGLVNNDASGSGEAGLYIGDSPHANAFVAGNDVWGNALGILYRHSLHASIEFNTIHDNCLGILVVAAPAPVGSGQIRNNTIRNNNKLCKANHEIPFDYSGGGVVLVGSTGELVGNNAVLHNRGTSPFSGGIVLVSAKPFHGPASSGNTVQRNTAYRNAPADIVDHSGGMNTFRHNFCTTSMPGGLCQH